MFIDAESWPKEIELRTNTDVLVNFSFSDRNPIDPCVSFSFRIHACQNWNESGLSSSIRTQKAKNLFILDVKAQRLESYVIIFSISGFVFFHQLFCNEVLFVNRHSLNFKMHSLNALVFPHEIIWISHRFFFLELKLCCIFSNRLCGFWPEF